MSKVAPFLWFNDNAKEAAKFTFGIPDAKKINELRSSGVGAWPAGKIATITIELMGQQGSGGDRQLLGQACCRRQADGVRLTDGQVRAVLADRT